MFKTTEEEAIESILLKLKHTFDFFRERELPEGTTEDERKSAIKNIMSLIAIVEILSKMDLTCGPLPKILLATINLSLSSPSHDALKKAETEIAETINAIQDRHISQMDKDKVRVVNMACDPAES